MKIILGLFAIVLAIIIGAGIAAPIGDAIQERNDYAAAQHDYDLQERQMSIERQQALQGFNTQAAAAWQLVGFFAAIGAIWFVMDFYNKRRDPLIKPDARGLLPVPRQALADNDERLMTLVVNAMAAFHRTQLEAAAQSAAVPHHLTYSPRISGGDRFEMDTPSAALPVPVVANVPSFAQLLDAGRIGRGVDGRALPLLLGYGSDGKPVEGDWKSLYSAAIGGVQGSGKTWTAAGLLAQSALAGAKLIICDPHAGDEESLAARTAPLRPAMVCQPAESETEIRQALLLAYDELQARKSGKSQDRTPWIVAIDEWSTLRRGELADVFPAYAEAFTTEGRKLGINAMFLVQRSDKESVGPFRNTVTSAYIHRMRPDEARMLTGLRAATLPDDTLMLPPGGAYLLDTRGQLTRIQAPMMTASDLERVGAMLGGEIASGSHGSEAEATKPRLGFQTAIRQHMAARVEAKAEVITEATPSSFASTASGSHGSDTPEAARILALFRGGKGIKEIVFEVWGVSGGRAFSEKSAIVSEVIRAALN